MIRCTRPRGALLGVLLACALVLSAQPLRAAPRASDLAGPPLPWLSAAHRDKVENALARTDDVRRAVETGDVETAVRAIARADGQGLPPRPRLPQPSARHLAQVQALPDDVRSPVAGLLAAVQEADRMLGRLPAADVQRAVAQLLDGMDTLPERGRRGPGAQTLRAPNGEPSHLNGQVPVLGEISTSPALRRAARQRPHALLLLAAALDRHLPELRRAAATRTGGAQAVGGCDLVDHPPYLCVGSEADNTYSRNVMLLVDLGGSNTFGNAAGAAPFVAAPPAGLNPDYALVSLHVALDGDSVYRAPQLPLLAGSRPAMWTKAMTLGQGAGFLNGIGILVDTGGDDLYRADAPPLPAATENFPQMTTIAQGAGVHGVGLLFDLAGRDRYEAVWPSTDRTVRSSVLAQANAQASYGGGCWLGSSSCRSIGSIVDRGTGDDSYLLHAGSFEQPGMPAYALAAASGQATGYDGVGIVYDEGGDDTFTATVRASTAGHTAGVSGFSSPMLVLQAQSYASVGTAMLLTGSGSRRYTIDAQASSVGIATWEVSGQAWGALGGTAVLQDRGTSASYHLAETVRDEHTFVVDDTCACEHAQLNVDVYAGQRGFAPVIVQGQGSARGGNAVLDNHGSGTYRAEARAVIVHHLDDRLSAPTAPPTFTVRGHQPPRLVAQGSQLPVLLLIPATSHALLLNRSGRATYDAVNQDIVRASASSRHGGTPEVTGVTPTQFDYSAAQGAGAWNSASAPGTSEGALVDLGGPGNTFTTVQDHSVATVPDSGGNFASGAFWMPSQGHGNGGVFVAEGDSPEVFARPANGICPGSPGAHGFGTWGDCSYYMPDGTDPDHTPYDFLAGSNVGQGSGHAPGATGTRPLLSVLSSPAQGADGEAVPVSAKLADASGQPLAGATLHVSLQLGIPVWRDLPVDPLLFQWVNITQAEGVTAGSGVAHVQLPLGLGRLWAAEGIPAGWKTQLLVTFDGAPGLYPRHASVPIEVTFPAGESAG